MFLLRAEPFWERSGAKILRPREMLRPCPILFRVFCGKGWERTPPSIGRINSAAPTRELSHRAPHLRKPFPLRTQSKRISK